MPRTKAAFRVEIERELCKGCELCIPVCPEGILALGEEFNPSGHLTVHILDEGRCTGCQKCALICPDVAIRILRED